MLWFPISMPPMTFLLQSLKLFSLQDHHSPTSNTNITSTDVGRYSDAVDFFFKRVQPDGFPEQQVTPPKLQPWKAVWHGPQVSEDGKLLIACKKGYDWGKTI